VSLEVDHIVPVAKGGLDTIENLQALCNRCNSGKTDTMSEP
jgi:5-methylcytosine-specific restriction endonuclease McrA